LFYFPNTTQQIESLAKRLKEVRKERGFTNYEQFAFENEIPRAQYSRYEKGHDLRFSSLIKILKAIDISLKNFLVKDLMNSNNVQLFTLKSLFTSLEPVHPISLSKYTWFVKMWPTIFPLLNKHSNFQNKHCNFELKM